MTDFFGPWDALLLLVVALCVMLIGAGWKWKYRKPPERFVYQQIAELHKIKTKDMKAERSPRLHSRKVDRGAVRLVGRTEQE